MKAKKLMCMLLAATMVCSSPLSALAGTGVEIQNTVGTAAVNDFGDEIQIIKSEITMEKPENLAQMTNVAQGASVTSNLACSEFHPIMRITDGQRNFMAADSHSGSFGQTTEGGDWYITVDLGSEKVISAVAMGKIYVDWRPESNNNLVRYQMQISSDGVTWKQLGEAEEEPEKNYKDVYFVPETSQSARYVRLYAPNAAAWSTVDEIEVYTEPEDPDDDEMKIQDTDISFEEPEELKELTNIALGCDVVSNLKCYGSHPASEATDGEYGYDGYNSGGSFAQVDNASGEDWYLTIDLGEIQSFKTIALKKLNLNNNPKNNLRRYQFQISEDGETWKQLGTAEEEPEETLKHVYFTPDTLQRARYIRLFSANVEGGWKVVDEIEVYSNQLPKVMGKYASNSTLKKGTPIELNAALDAEIYYTLDGSDPTKNGVRYEGPIELDGDMEIRAYAKKDGYEDSNVSMLRYFMQYIEADPEPGRVEPGTEVAFTNQMAGSEIYYTLDSSDPLTSDSAILYTEPIKIDSYSRIMAYCKGNAGGDSPVYEFTYTTENAVEGKTVTASKEENGTKAAMAADGDEDTMWQAGANQWIKIDFGAPYDFDCVNINWADEAANYKYIIETSSNNENWYTYASYPGGNNAAQTHVIPNVETHRQYMRIKILGADAGATYGIREIEVAGKESAEIPEIPMYDNPETDLYDRVVVNPMPEKVEGVKDPQISLDGEWNFTVRPQNGFWRNTTDLSGWDTANIPGDLDAEGFPVYDVENPDWTGGYGDAKFYPGNNLEMAYKRQIFVPEDYEGQKVFLRVDKAFNYARIWVNGQYVRDHRGEFNAWDADITDYIIPGQENWITISITAEGSYNDAGQLLSFVGLRSIRGITSDVTMYAAPKTYLNRLHVNTDLDENYEDAELTIMTNTFLEDGKEADINLSLTDRNGNPVALEKDSIHVGADDNFTDKNVTMTIENPEKWDAEHPNLYTLTAEVAVDGNVTETVVKKIGFREITIEDSVYKINGLPTKLRGVNYHTVYGNDGIAYDLDAEKELLETLKRNNINYIRAAHYPLSDKTLNLCDELGIFVEQENSMTFDFTSGSNSWPQYKTYLLHACSEMVEKDRSHPSIVIWSIANETSWGSNHDATSRYIKAVDPTIPTKFSWGSQIPANAAIDIQSNHYSMDGVGRYGRPTVWDEFAHDYSHGNEAHMRFDPGLRENYYQIIKNNWEQIYNNAINLGGAIWDYTDNTYEGKNRVTGNSNWGQVDAWGREKPEIWATKNVYSPVQYKGEDAISLPAKKNASIELLYENRYETVAFDDADFEILYSVNGSGQKTLKSDITPKDTGMITIPAPAEGWKMGDKIILEFYKTTSGIRRNVVTNVITIGAAAYSAPEVNGTAPEITEDEEAIHVTGTDFVLDFSKTTGKITNGSYKEETVLTGGPHLNLGMNAVGNWTLGSITAEVEEDAAVLVIDGSYSASNVGGCVFTLKINAEGQIETTYQMKNTGNISGYEIGVAYDLPASADTISWVRDGYLSYYPESQLGRLEGTAVKETDWKREYGVKPSMEWKDDDKDFYNFGPDDQGERGTNDFRASKTGIYYAEMGYGDSKAVLSVYGDGKGSVRAVMNEDKTVCFNINNAWGYPVNGLSQIGQKAVNAAPGYTNTVVMRISDDTKNYEVSYGEIPAAEFIKVLSASAGSEYASGNAAVNVINNSGMSSDTTLDSTHDNNGSAYTMWHTGNQPGEKAWIQVDFGRICSLDQMWIWNHNQNNLTSRGLKNVKIEYSEDGSKWTELEKPEDMTFTNGNAEYPFQFACAGGAAGQKATNLNDGKNTPVSFGGVSARYVKVTAAPTAGDGTWGATYYGLSELRFTETADSVELPYEDVEETDWFYDDVCTMYEKGLMTGVDEVTFAPAQNLTRDQFAVILWRAEGSPKMEYSEKFADVAEGQWYTDAVLWANEKGIATGYADSKLFGPADPISREQVAVMLYRYAKYKGYDVNVDADLTSYEDAKDIQEYAKEAMEWAVGAEIIKGKDGQNILAPQGRTNRAETAAILSRFLQKYEK